MVVTIGSMAIKGVFNAGSLLSGLGKTSGKLKEVQSRGKSTTTEIKRMTGQTHLLSKAMAAIGVAGFSALLMTTPQLTGSLAKIKHEMTMLAWSIGKHLKPSLDAVATILRGIRTGDWSVIIRGVKELTGAVVDLIANAGEFVIELILEVPIFADLHKDFTDWIDGLKTAWEEGDLLGLISGMMEPAKWLNDVFNDIIEYFCDMGINAIGAFIEGFKTSPLTATYETIMALLPPVMKPAVEFGGRAIEHESRQIGGYVPQSGLYNLHAGETVTMKGSTPSSGTGSTNITLDFSSAVINLASGIELNDFAEVISNKIAEHQHALTY